MPTEIPPLEAMVVDDEADIRDLIADYLRTNGVGVATAHDGRAAVAALERSGGRYGLVVTDINMPGADGFDVLRAARAANASACVVIVTGYASLDTAIQAVRLGAHDYLTKPFTLGQLGVMLRNINARRALERENRELLSRPAPDGQVTIADRLASIEARLARIETLLTSPRR